MQELDKIFDKIHFLFRRLLGNAANRLVGFKVGKFRIPPSVRMRQRHKPELADGCAFRRIADRDGIERPFRLVQEPYAVYQHCSVFFSANAVTHKIILCVHVIVCL